MRVIWRLPFLRGLRVVVRCRSRLKYPGVGEVRCFEARFRYQYEEGQCLGESGVIVNSYNLSHLPWSYLCRPITCVAETYSDIELIEAVDVACFKTWCDRVGQCLATPHAVVKHRFRIYGIIRRADGHAHVAFTHYDPAVAFCSEHLVGPYLCMADQRDLQRLEEYGSAVIVKLLQDKS